MKKISLFLYLFITFNLVHAQNTNNEIPFRLTQYNNIVVPVILNETDSVQLMFHTGSDYISMIEQSLPKLKSMQINDTIQDVTSWAGNSDQLMSKNNSVSLGNQHYKAIPILIDQQSGHETDGKIGLKFFQNKFIEIDFESNKLKVYDVLPNYAQSFGKLESRYSNHTLYFNAFPIIDKNSINTEFMFHTGYSGAIVFSDEYVKNNHLLEKINPTGQTQFSDAAGNKIISKTGILEQLDLQNQSLNTIPISFFDSQIKIQRTNIFGGDLIKRFNWIFSSDFKTIYFKPNKHFHDSYFKL